MSDELRELYQEVLLDHARSPRNFRQPDDTTCQAKGDNPLCGDQLMVFVTIKDPISGIIEDIGFLGKGCAISVASASLMTELIKGKSIDEITWYFETFKQICTQENPRISPRIHADDIERMQILNGVRQFPIRVKCATLAWHTLKAAMAGSDNISTEDEEN